MKILVYQTAFLGDLILTIPLINAIHKVFNNPEIVVVVRGGLGDLMREQDGVKEVIEYYKNGRDGGFIPFVNLIKRIREENFDIVFAPHRSFRTTMIMLFSGVPERVGFKESALSFVYTKRVSRTDASHEIEKNLLLLRVMNNSFGMDHDILKLKIRDDIYEKVEKKLSEYGVTPHDPVVTVAPGSQWGTKRWLPEGFAEVISRLHKEGVKVVLVGSEGDREIARNIEVSSGYGLINLCGFTSILESAAIISISRVLLSNDSASVHLASLTGTPVVVIYGPTIPAFGFSPYGVEHIIIESKDLKCRPCSSHGPQKCPEGHFKCMKQISSVEVYTAVKKLLLRYAEKI